MWWVGEGKVNAFIDAISHFDGKVNQWKKLEEPVGVL